MWCQRREFILSRKKQEAVANFPVPKDVKALRSFLGLASYYRKFVPYFARVAGPLHSLTKKDTMFVWSAQFQQAFEQLKSLLTSAPVAAFPNFANPFILEEMLQEQA